MGCRVRGMTTQEYRASYNYREEYFKQNPGLFGCVWFCSQCFKPLIGKQNVVVDHIRPLNKGGRNHVSNCTACCQKCNSAKSDIVDGRMYRGYAFKAVESAVSRANKGVGAVAGLGVGLTASAASAVLRTGTKAGKRTARFGFGVFGKLVGLVLKFVTFPLRTGSLTSRLLFLAVYTLCVMHLLSTYTNLLNAWM